MSRLQSVAGRVPQGWSFGHWPLRRKLAAAVALPVILAFVFGGLRVQSDVTSAQQLSRAADTVQVIRPIVDYNLAVQRLAAAGSVGGSGVISAITRYESAAADLRIALKVPGIPETVKRNAQSALALGQAVRTAKTQNGFSDVVIDRSGNIATLLSTAVSDLGLSDDSASAKIVVSLQDTIAAQRAMTGQQLNLANADDGAAALRAIGQTGAETAALTRLQSNGFGDATQIRQLLNESGRRASTLQQETQDAEQIAALAPVIESSNAEYSKLIDSELSALESNLRERASAFRDTAILNAVLVAVALLAALTIVLALLRSLLTPIRAVRQGALDVAQKRLPEAVAAMRDGTEPPAFVAIPVHTREEMGQLARAVDDLHTQALTLAGDQARLRVQVGHMFETLSRRSTSLIDQQLSLIERLESDEEDPKRLQSLFRLDHLAARMRRNSDSLLVLAGTSTRRGFSGAVSVSDAVRAAVSEVENYERIDIGDTSNDQVLGAVGSDLIHLVAEVIDNALAYSPPTTRVDIRGARTPEGGLLVEVSDRGLGMPPKELAALNDRLAHGGDITPDTARRMGLFVVGSLAKRHGIAVRLRRNGDDRPGITVSVHLPAGLLADTAGRADRPVRPAAKPAAAPAPAALAAPTAPAVGGTTKAGLPTRVRGASGAPSPVVDAAKKVLPTRTPGAHGPTSADAITAVPIKPVIEGAAAAEAKPATNGHGTNGTNGTNGHGTNGQADDAKVAEAKAAADAKAVADAKAADEAKAADAAARVEADRAETARIEADRAETARIEAARAAEAKAAADAKAVADAKAAEEAATQVATGMPAEAKAAAEAKAVEEAKAAEVAEAARLKATQDAEIAAQAEAARAAAEQASAAAATDAAPRSAAGLPMRKPRATGITEATEFGAAPATDSTDSSGTADTADKAGDKGKGSRLTSWLPSRKAAEAARVEAEEAETHRMPSNLSAWLEHRAAVTEAREKAERGETETESSTDAGTDATTEAASVEVAETTELTVPDAWVSEATSTDQPSTGGTDAPATTEQGLPTRVPGASGSTTPVEAEPEPFAGRPALRAHNTSFFGARKAVAAPEADATPVVEADTTPQTAPAVEVPVAVATDTAPIQDTTVDQVEEQIDVQADPQASSASAAAETTPIFRSMMSSSGLPMRRPGTTMNPTTNPGESDAQAEEPAAPATSRRDPEAIRRSLNRHQNGVSTARTEAQDGTHREEADVHH
ncbi:hypothetical protein GCM10009867_16230 [Pedococcus aerophilus]|uniref:histidine kinase n=1 Tax=Pedococcus aerophilus TaxID=436356 RepID=A0ABN3UMB7_9MICO